MAMPRAAVLSTAADAHRDPVSGKIAVVRIPEDARAPTLADEEMLESVEADDPAQVAFFVRVRGADPGLADYLHGGGRRPVHAAVASRRWKALDALLALGADVNAGDSRGRTPLHVLARQGDEAAARTLLLCAWRRGAAVDCGAACLGTGYTPLHLAVRAGAPDLVVLLLEAAAAAEAAPGRVVPVPPPALGPVRAAADRGLGAVAAHLASLRGIEPGGEEADALRTRPPGSLLASSAVPHETATAAVRAEAAARREGMLVAGDGLGMPRRVEEMAAGPGAGQDEVSRLLLGSRWADVDDGSGRAGGAGGVGGLAPPESKGRGGVVAEAWAEAGKEAEEEEEAEEEADGASVVAAAALTPRPEQLQGADFGEMIRQEEAARAAVRAEERRRRRRTAADEADGAKAGGVARGGVAPREAGPGEPDAPWLRDDGDGWSGGDGGGDGGAVRAGGVGGSAGPGRMAGRHAEAGAALPPPRVVDARTSLGETPLLLACRAGEGACAAALAAAGADASARTAAGRTALGLATAGGHTSLAASLIEHCGASLYRWEDASGATSLETASRLGDPGAAVTLLALEDRLRSGAAAREAGRAREAEAAAAVEAQQEVRRLAQRRADKKRALEDRREARDKAYLARCREIRKNEARERKEELQEITAIRAAAARREREAAKARFAAKH